MKSVPHWVQDRPGCFRAADDREWQTRRDGLDHAINHLRLRCRPTRPLVRALPPCRPKTTFSLVVQYPNAVQRRRSAPPLSVHRHSGGAERQQVGGVPFMHSGCFPSAWAKRTAATCVSSLAAITIRDIRFGAHHVQPETERHVEGRGTLA